MRSGDFGRLTQMHQTFPVSNGLSEFNRIDAESSGYGCDVRAEVSEVGPWGATQSEAGQVSDPTSKASREGRVVQPFRLGERSQWTRQKEGVGCDPRGHEF